MRSLALWFLWLGATSAAADDVKPTQFWNLTSSTVVSLRLSHAGSGEFGDNVAPKGVRRDERLDIADLPSGQYDMELKFQGGRACFVHNVEVLEQKAFIVEDPALRNCRKR